MAITPYVPTAFATPVANPSVGSAGVAYPYCSPSEFLGWPTALDTTQLVPGQGEQAQLQALADVLSAASADMDRFCFGQDVAAKGASLAATVSIESAQVTAINGELRLVCNYKPIVQVNGVDVGFDAANMSSVGPSVAGQIRIGIRTIHVPLMPLIYRSGSTMYPAVSRAAGSYYVVWSYVNGYPHTELAADVAAGATTVDVLPTDGGTGLLGIVPNVTRLTIRDGVNTESFTVSAVSGTTLTTASPLRFAHTLPQAPDFLPVTAMPDDIKTACIFMGMFLIKTRGDSALMLQPISEPNQAQHGSADEYFDLTYARDLLTPYRMRWKGHT